MSKEYYKKVLFDVVKNQKKLEFLYDSIEATKKDYHKAIENLNKANKQIESTSSI